ncbi:hypothetical protein CNMCM7691_008580 [Aspergillus felis]|uniref:Prion-inhibition and propagation HeLo domain-containing protein n=1 Tax=Aspergillus felis TaxID=1287682 RepID=A0A8H6QMB1_9EURO|nr:hypothetical protein CNMCM7691_008580 [Aspergillus felis]
MEPISFSLAVAGIPAIFVSCIDCFRYVKLSRAFGADFGFCLAKLEAAELEFTRWGQAMGLLHTPFDPDALFKKGPWKEEDVMKAMKWLALIEDAFEDAWKTSEKFKLSHEDGDEPEILEIPDETAELEKSQQPLKKLILSLRQVTKRRQKLSSLGRKAQWALYRKTDFESLIETICRLVDNLVKLFPAVQDQQKQLCKEEVQVVEPESIPTLVKILGDNDRFLNLAITEEIREKGHKFEDVIIDGSGFTRLGDTYQNIANAKSTPMSVSRMRVAGSGVTHIGHRFTTSTPDEGTSFVEHKKS